MHVSIEYCCMYLYYNYRELMRRRKLNNNRKPYCVYVWSNRCEWFHLTKTQVRVGALDVTEAVNLDQCSKL